MISVSKEYETDIITLFHATGDFNYRSRWQEGVKTVEEVNHFLPRVGMRCRCILENGQLLFIPAAILISPERIEFSETDEKKKSSVYFILEKILDKRTRLTINMYLRKNFGMQLFFNLTMKNKMKRDIEKSLENLKTVASEIHLPPVTLKN